jgi:hypothetical protein
MDPSLALAWRAPVIVEVQAAAVRLQPAWLPGWLPLRSLAPATRSALAAGGPLPRPERLAWALEADDGRAWAIGRWPRDPATDGVLALWAARRAAALGLPPAAEGLVVLGPVTEVRAGWLDAQRIITALGGVPWAGPVVVVADDRPFADLPAGPGRILRPGLPVIRVVGDGPRARTAAALVALAVDLQGPAPDWWRTGLIHLASVRPDPGPRAHGERRAQAGRERIDRQLRGPVDDPALAAAVAAWCIDPRRTARVADLRALFRAGPTGLDLLARVHPGLPGFD